MADGAKPGTTPQNIRLLGHNDLGGFGNGGEGITLQVRPDGKKFLFIAHAFAPKDISIVDVSDPRDPTMVFQNDLPHDRVRSNCLSLSGNILAVTRQALEYGGEPAGLAFFDVSDPTEPREIGFFDTSGPTSEGTHFVWYTDGETAFLSTGMPDFKNTHKSDRYFPVILDVSDPTNPKELGRWWLQGTRDSDDSAPIKRPPEILAESRGEKLTPTDRAMKSMVGDDVAWDFGYRSHNIYVDPRRPDRAYVGYINGGVIILDISDLSSPTMVGRLEYSPPLPGYTHTVMPLLGQDTLIVTDECVVDYAADWPKLMWLADARYEEAPRMLGPVPMPDVDAFRTAGRYGAHNIHENAFAEAGWKSEDLVFGTFFSGGVRVYDVRDPLHPREAASFVPDAPAGQEDMGIQINDLFVDSEGIIYAVDRTRGGLYTMELDVEGALQSN